MNDTNVYTYLTPIALVFILLEIGLCFAFRRDYVSFPESVANFGTALATRPPMSWSRRACLSSTVSFGKTTGFLRSI
jgi:hypothetical protein